MIEQKITFDKLVRWVGIVAAVGLSYWVINRLSGVLLPFFVAWLFAYLLYPLVLFVQNKLHVKIRALSIIIALLLVLAVIGGVVYLIIPPMISQFTKLGTVVSAYATQKGTVNEITRYIQVWITENHQTIEHYFTSKEFTDTLQKTLPQVFSFLGGGCSELR